MLFEVNLGTSAWVLKSLDCISKVVRVCCPDLVTLGAVLLCREQSTFVRSNILYQSLAVKHLPECLAQSCNLQRTTLSERAVSQVCL